MMASNTATNKNSRPPTIPPISASDRKSPLDSKNIHKEVKLVVTKSSYAYTQSLRT